MPGEDPVELRGRIADVADTPKAVSTYFEALNSEDWDRLATVWAEDAELAAVGSRPRQGRAEVMAYFRSIFKPWSSHLDSPTRIITAQDTVVVEVEFTGVSQSGKELTFDAVDIFDLNNGEILKLTTWYDLSWLRKQL